MANTPSLDDLSRRIAQLLGDIQSRREQEPEPGSPMARKMEALQKQLDAAYEQQRAMQGPPIGTRTTLAPRQRSVTALDFSLRQPTPVFQRPGAKIAPSENGTSPLAAPSAPIPQANAELSEERYRLKLEAQMRGAPAGEQPRIQAMLNALNQRPAGVSRQDWTEALAKVEQNLYQEKQRQLEAEKKKTQETLEAQAYFARTGMVHPSQVREVPGMMAALRAGGGGQAIGIAQHLIMAQTQQGAHPMGNQFAGVASAVSAFSALPGPIGKVAGGLGLVVSATGHIISAFRTVHDTTQSLAAAQAEWESNLRESRQTGLGSPGALRSVLNQQELAQYTQAVAGGNTAQAVQVLEQARARLRPAAAEAPLSPEREAAARAALDRAEATVRSTDWRLFHFGENRASVRMRELRAAGFREAEIGQLPTELLSEQERRNLARTLGTGRSIEAVSGVESINRILQSGVLPNLQAGGLNLQDLPSLFQSRQGNVLDIHAQVQQEAVRDMRQQQQFQAQMDMWERILDAINRNRFQPQPVVGGN